MISAIGIDCALLFALIAMCAIMVRDERKREIQYASGILDGQPQRHCLKERRGHIERRG